MDAKWPAYSCSACASQSGNLYVFFISSLTISHLLSALFCSKEGSAQVKLRLGLVGDDSGHTFMFTSPQSTAVVEREAFKRELTNIISGNRNLVQPTVATPKTAAQSNDATPQRVQSMPMSRATSVSSSERASAVPSRAIDDFRIRKRVLMKTPELAALHRELVLSGQITETEFWEGREVMLSFVSSH